MTDAGITPIALTQSMSLFLGLMPGPDSLLKTDSTDYDKRQSVRVRETAAVAMSLGSGILLAVISRDARPFYISLVVSAALVGASEFLIHCSTPNYLKDTGNEQ